MNIGQPIPLKTIDAKPNSAKEYLRELWRYKNLLWIFTIQDLKVQYVQTKLNLLWLILKPLMVVVLFTFIFDRVVHIPDLFCPYPLFAFSGLIIWNFFSQAVGSGGGAILNQQQLIKKVYFPRLILILVKVLIALLEAFVSIILLLFLSLFLQFPISAKVVFLPIVLLIAVVFTLSIVIWIAAWSIRHRDIHQLVPTVLGFVIWLTPVFYPVSLIPSSVSYLIYLNPLAGLIQGFRWAMVDDVAPSLCYLPVFLVSCVGLVFGLYYYVSVEDKMADFI